MTQLRLWCRAALTPFLLCASPALADHHEKGETKAAPAEASQGEVVVEQSDFGATADGEPVTSFTISNDTGVKLTVISYGATVQALHVPGRDGKTADIVLGFDDVAGYEQDRMWHGRTVGRFANRIAEGKFEINGTEYQVPTNLGKHHLHGGTEKALGKVVWESKVFDNPKTNAKGVRFTRVSPDGEEGYPGKVRVNASYSMVPGKPVVRMYYRATTDRPTPLNLTNHSYFNLHGHDGDPITDHVLKLNCTQGTETDADLIPTGKKVDLAGTPDDFLEPTAIGQRIDDAGYGGAGGYDDNFWIDGEAGKVRLAARVADRDSGRVMLVRTQEPCVQFFTGNLNEPKGKGGAAYKGYCSFCLETQHAPDSVNRPEFPSTIVTPDEPFESMTIWEFKVLGED